MTRAFGDIRAEIETHFLPRGKVVTMAIGPIFEARWLAPRLSSFRKEEITIAVSNMVLQVALRGQGVSLGIFAFVQKEVDAGLLIKPFDIDLRPPRSFHLLSKSGSQRTAPVAAVMK